MAATALINLQRGCASPRLLAADGLLEGARAVLTSSADAAAAMAYGPHLGHLPLRQSIAAWLTSLYRPQAGPVAAERICITNGASGNLANVLQQFTDPLYTRRIFLAEPTYFLACPIFEDSGFQGRLRGIPENEHGPDTAFLRRALVASEEEEEEIGKPPDGPRLKTGPRYPKIYRYVIYVVATFANPSGKTMTLEARRDLVRLAREFDALVVSDDVYDFLVWPTDPSAPDDAVSALVPPRLVDVDHLLPGAPADDFGNTVSNGSFSKVIGPGVRVGWAESTPLLAAHLADVGPTNSGGPQAHLMSTFIDKMLRSGYVQKHVQALIIPTFRKRYYVLMDAIQTNLYPLGVINENAVPPSVALAGGFFAYLRLPSDLPPAQTVAAFALEYYKLRLAFGQMFLVSGDATCTRRSEQTGGCGHCVRLCWAWHEEAELREGIDRLAAVIVDMRERLKTGEDVGSRLTIGIR